MKYLAVLIVAAVMGLWIPYKMDEAYAKGRAEALKTNPVSAELELVCAGLWVGEQAKKQHEKDMK